MKETIVKNIINKPKLNCTGVGGFFFLENAASFFCGMTSGQPHLALANSSAVAASYTPVIGILL